MVVSSRTTEGLPNECPICGKQVWIAPTVSPGDATCPHCGSGIWFSGAPLEIPDVFQRLEELGVIAEADDEGEVRSIRLTGREYTDAVIEQLAQLQDLETLDLSGTFLTSQGIARLRELLPRTRIICDKPRRAL